MQAPGDADTLVWQFGINIRAKEIRGLCIPQNNDVVLGGRLEQILKTSRWHLYCSKKKRISYPLQENRRKDSSEISNKWHTAVVTFHLHLNPSGFIGICVCHPPGAKELTLYINPWLMGNFALKMQYSRLFSLGVMILQEIKTFWQTTFIHFQRILKFFQFLYNPSYPRSYWLIIDILYYMVICQPIGNL